MDAAHARASVPRFVRDPAHDLFGEGGAIDAMFHPKTVAVVGATSQPGSLGYQTLAALSGSGFEGSVVVVDPGAQARDVLVVPEHRYLHPGSGAGSARQRFGT